MRTRSSRSGFTLLEIALTIGILGILLSLSMAVAHNAIGRAGLRSSENALVQSIRRAQVLSQNNVGGAQYGVFIQTGSIIIFSGSTFALRSTDADQVFDINDQISPDGVLYLKMKNADTGLVFMRFTGNPTPSNFSGAIILRMANENKTVTVNGKGTVGR